MAERGTGTITDVATGGVTRFSGVPTSLSPQQQLLGTEIERLKKFYGEQYKVEMGKFASQPMSDEEFKDIAGKLQSKYKLAFNEAKFQMESRQKPPKEFSDYSELDAVENKIESELRGFMVLPGGETPSRWRASRQPPSTAMKVANVLPPIAAYNIGRAIWPKEKIQPEEVQVRDLSGATYDEKTGEYKGGSWKTSTPEEADYLHKLLAAKDIIRQRKAGAIGIPASDIMKTFATSKRQGGAITQRVGGSIGQQTTNYLQQKETVAERQEPEDFSKMSDEELKRIAEGR